MDSAATSQSQTFRPTAVQELLHVSALNAFAIVQPILDSFVNNVAFLRYYNYSTSAVMLAIAILTLGLPTLQFCLRSILHRMGFPRIADQLHKVLLAMLFLVAFSYATRWMSSTFCLADYGVPDELLLLTAILASGWLTQLYYRSEILRQMLLLSLAGVVLYPAVFFLNPAIQEEVLLIPLRTYFQPVTAQSPTPVIFVVFDGLSGMAILDKNHKIDRGRYPSFARLGDRSHFFRNASTVHIRTDHALPAILSGSMPTGTQQPVESEYPLNLFRLLDNSRQFEFSIFEPFTQLAPNHLRRLNRSEGQFRQAFALLETALRVYQRMCLPRAMESWAVDVPREWFRILPPSTAAADTLDGKIVYPWDTGVDLQVQHFVRCLRNTERPGLRFLHLALPHDPWTRLPSGQQYREQRVSDDVIPGGTGQTWVEDEWLVNQGWQRYLFQVQYADACLGAILDKLEETDLFDDALIVVTADHGFAFHKGCSRRDPQSQNLSDLIPVPLLIKYPHQQSGEVSDRNVETIDILPTVADVLGLPADPAWDGQSLRSATVDRPRKTVVAGSDLNSTIIIEAAFPGRFRYVERLHEVFKNRDDGALQNLQFLPELYGKDVSTFLTNGGSEHSLSLTESFTPAEAHKHGFVPCYYAGLVHGMSVDETPAILAVAVNGVIQATTRTSTAPECLGLWTVMVPDSAFSGPNDRVQFYDVERIADTVRLRELKLE